MTSAFESERKQQLCDLVSVTDDTQSGTVCGILPYRLQPDRGKSRVTT